MRIRAFLVVVCLSLTVALQAQVTGLEFPPTPELPVLEEPQPPLVAPVASTSNDESSNASELGATSVEQDRSSQVQRGRLGAVTTNSTATLVQTDPDITATLGTSTWASSFTIFNSTDPATRTPLLRVRGDGVVGVGTADPAEFMEIVRNSTSATFLQISNSNATSLSGLRLAEGATKKFQIAAYNSGFASPATLANGLQVTNIANGPMLFATNNAERMRILADGSVAIGTTTTESSKLRVLDFKFINAGVVDATTLRGATLSAGVQGSGTIASTVGQVISSGVMYGHGATINSAYGAQVQLTATAPGKILNGYGVYILDVPAEINAYAIYQASTDDANYFAGQLRVGSTVLAAGKGDAKLHVTGNAHFTGIVSGGTIQATYQDVAEWVPSTTELAPGTVVVLNAERNNEVMASSSPYDTAVAGVVSAQPGLSLGVPGEGKEQVATTGRVKVRVDARTAPIRIGDLLVTSTVPGAAMKSEPMEISGRKFHQPGTIIGKALEPLESGIGEILVLLSMQ